MPVANAPKSATAEKVEAAPVETMIATLSKSTNPNDSLFIIFDPRLDPSVNTTRLEFMVMRTAAAAGGQTQQVPDRLALEPGVNISTNEVWEAIENSPLEHVKEAIKREALRVMEPWEELKMRDRRELVGLCSSAALVPLMQRWLADETSDYVKADLTEKITALSGVTPDQFAAIRGMVA